MATTSAMSFRAGRILWAAVVEGGVKALGWVEINEN